jgi:hypothetical protein
MAVNGVQSQVLAAIADGETTAKGICDITGFERNAVHQAVFLLKKGGLVTKNENGYAIGDGAEVPAPAPHTPSPAKKPRRARRKRVAAKRPTAKGNNGYAANDNGHAAVEFARFGDFVVLKKADVVDLLRAMQRWQQMVEGII